MKANRLLPALAILALAACAEQERPAPAPPPRPPAARPVVTAPPPPAAPADWRDAARTPGTWTWSMENGRSTARYGVAGQDSVAMLSCDAASRATILWRTGAAPAATALVITTTGTRRVVDAAPDARGGASARLPASDALLDAIAFSRGRFMAEMPENQALYLPSWPEITRVVEDCRRG